MLVVSRQSRSAAGRLPVERALATLREAGFDGAGAVRVLRMLIAYIVGSLLREVGVTPTFAPAQTGTIRADGVDPALFPEVTSLAGLLGECDHEAEFGFGLDLLIRAVEERAGRRESGAEEGIR
ncbi:TetR/AcrR family transcriptional regulator C-terminal domain-containing protein [Nonomuraea fastidiosa]|jgi:hypothetical protein|uniref:TetR/AcrR family transcriptional regulator C-terminal domain-containing protein n=1 Tax=Nonomuraea TaxID=83681 RepID=UPI00324A4E3E